MKILNITKNNYLCELSKEELEVMLGKTLYRDDIEKAFRNEQDIKLKTIFLLVSEQDINFINRATKDLETAIEFLENKKEAIAALMSVGVQDDNN